MKPLSAIYYIKQNKRRAILLIIMLMTSTFLYLVGAYISCISYFYDKEIKYGNRIITAYVQSDDENYADFHDFIRECEKDPDLVLLRRSPKGHASFMFKTTLGLEMTADSFVFENKDDLKTAFDNLGIECDYSQIKDHSIVISKAFAANVGLKLGDQVDEKYSRFLNGTYTIDAIIYDNSYNCFYVENSGAYDSDSAFVEANIISKSRSGQDFWSYLSDKRGERKLVIAKLISSQVDEQFAPFILLFYGASLILGLILSVVVNSVLTEFYLKRRFEFGLYRAIGMSRGRLVRKVAAEILLMNLIAVVLGAGLIMLFTFLMNEMIYLPSGRFLPYWTLIGLFGFLMTDAMVLIPTIITKGVGMTKVDVTEF